MNIKAINFDFYGTLFNWLQIWKDVSQVILKEHNVKISPQDFANEWRATQRKLIEDKEFIKYKECITSALDMLCQKYEMKNQNYEKILFSKWKEIKPFPEVPNVLKKLKEKYVLAVCSNSSRDLFNVSAKKLPVKFDYVLISDETKATKPHRKMYEIAVKALGFNHKNILHIASSQMDVRGATNAGLNVCWINRLNEKKLPETPKPRFEIKKLDEVFEFLK